MHLSEPPIHKKTENGFSLIEIIITIVVMAIVLGAVFALMRGSLMTSKTNYEVTRVQQELRFAQEYINRDVLTAGEGIGGASQIWLKKDFVVNYITSKDFDATLKDPGNPNYALMSPIVSDEDVPDGTQIGGLPGKSVIKLQKDSDRLTLLSVNPDFTPLQLGQISNSEASVYNASTNSVWVPSEIAEETEIGQVLYFTNEDKACFAEVTAKADESLTFSGDGNFKINGDRLAAVVGSGGKSLTLMKMNIVTYFVGEDRVLRRRIVGDSSGGRDDVIATNVAHLNFGYISTTDQDYKVFTPPTSILSSRLQRNAVRMIQATITGRTLHPLENGSFPEYTSTALINIRNQPFGLAAAGTDISGKPGDGDGGDDPCADPQSPECICKDKTGTDKTCCLSNGTICPDKPPCEINPDSRECLCSKQGDSQSISCCMEGNEPGTQNFVCCKEMKYSGKTNAWCTTQPECGSIIQGTQEWYCCIKGDTYMGCANDACSQLPKGTQAYFRCHGQLGPDQCNKKQCDGLNRDSQEWSCCQDSANPGCANDPCKQYQPYSQAWNCCKNSSGPGCSDDPCKQYPANSDDWKCCTYGGNYCPTPTPTPTATPTGSPGGND